MILLAMLPALAIAEHVETARAQQAAKTFFNNNGVNATKLTDVSAEAGFANLYIYKADRGFVVMAADDRVQPILGYSLTGSFLQLDIPENVKCWLQGYSDEIQYIIDNRLSADPEATRQWNAYAKGEPLAKATVVVEPLLSTQWDQGDPYNQQCPTVNGSATYSGCVATSMAQIMKYWNWPIQGNNSHSYTWNGQSLSANFGATTYDWANMTDTYDWNSTEAEETAVATLMYHCGVSVNMDYGTDGSGAYSTNIPSALTSYFRYNSSVSSHNKPSFNTNNFISSLKTELNNARPIQYSGSGTGGGHAFVCDGYDNSNYFHFNWGWSGMYDGYFQISNLNPGTGGSGSGSTGTYNWNQAAIYPIYPNYSISNAPSGLTATLVQDILTRNVNLSWSSLSGASSYQVFRNGRLIGTVSSTTYVDEAAPYGDNEYFIRGVTSSNGISPYSNKVSVSISFATPTNLRASLDERLFTVSWDATDLAVSYNLYCNDRIIGSGLTSTSFTFTLKVYGDLVFYVKGVDFLGDLSEASNNSETLFQEFDGPLVDLTATIEDNDVTLSWDALVSDTGYISQLGGYGGSIYGSSLSSNGAYWALRFPPSELSFYAGMAVLEVKSWFYEAGTYQVSIYQGTNNDAPAGSPLATTSRTLEAQAYWQTFTFDNPVLIDHTQDLWIVFNSSNVSMLLLANMENPLADYYSTNGTTWNHATGCTWIVYALISDGNYSYNLYRNGEAIASNMTTTSYTDHDLDVGTYEYYVKTNYYGGESAASNTISFEIANQVLALSAGWNWWAPMVAASNLLTQLQHTPGIMLITSEDGTQASSIVPGQMYRIQTSQTVNLNVRGIVADLNALEITIAPSINWFGYPGKTAININAANITPADGDKIISQDEGFATYENGAWTGTLTTLEPGHGYVYVSAAQEAKTLKFE